MEINQYPLCRGYQRYFVAYSVSFEKDFNKGNALKKQYTEMLTQYLRGMMSDSVGNFHNKKKIHKKSEEL